MDHRPRYKMQNYELLMDNIGENLGNIGFGGDFFSPKSVHGFYCIFNLINKSEELSSNLLLL